MIFHVSISAENPQHVASVIAELWRGEYTAFPPYDGAYVALANDDRNTLIEVYRKGGELIPADGMEDAAMQFNPRPNRNISTHVAIASPLKEKDIHAIAEREGWIAKTLNRGGLFHVVEFWLENEVMIEVLPKKMQKEYLANMTAKKWRQFMQEAAPEAAA